MNETNIRWPYEIILHRKIKTLEEREAKLIEALKKNKSEWQVLCPDSYRHLVAWQMARDVLEDTDDNT